MTNKTRINLDRRTFLAASGATLASGVAAAFATALAGCAQQQPQPQQDEPVNTEPEVVPEPGSKITAIDYLALVNKHHKLPDGWEDVLDLVEEKSLIYTEDDNSPSVIKVERKAYDAYQALKEDLAAEGIGVELDSCYRSVAEQQEIVDDFTKEYGEEYVKQHVATPGYSEHHTGLALDLFLVIDGQNVYLNEEMERYPEVWAQVHAKLADHGFILRYPYRKKVFSGYSYEPWHIRYLDDPDVARKIMDDGSEVITFEEYLDEVEAYVADCEVDYGQSALYADSSIDSALDVILDEFHNWTGCVMKRIAFAGDSACDAEELAYLNELREATMPESDEFDQVIVFVTDFRTGTEKETEQTAWEANADYDDYTWHLGRTGEDGEWHLMTWGYA